MKNIISNYKGFILYSVDDVYFIDSLFHHYVDMSGSKDEILNELNRWRNTIDGGNRYMYDIETHFINVLNKI